MSKKQNPQSQPKRNKELDITKGVVLYDNILLRPIIMEQSGVVLRPQQYEDKPEYGEVVAVGEGRIFDNGTVIPLKVKVGDKVLFQKYSYVKVRSMGEDFLLIREEDVYIVL